MSRGHRSLVGVDQTSRLIWSRISRISLTTAVKPPNSGQCPDIEFIQAQATCDPGNQLHEVRVSIQKPNRRTVAQPRGKAIALAGIESALR